MKTVYEWDIETVDLESQDILDHDHASTLIELIRYKTHHKAEQGTNYQLVLVKDTIDQKAFPGDGLKERTHWYPESDGFPIFSNGEVVPNRFVIEFKENWK